MKKLLSVLLAVMLMAAVSVPTASAWEGGRHGRGGWGERHEFHGGGGGLFPGYAFGAITGLLLGGALTAPYYVAPPPAVYVAPPPPTCYTRPGFWSQVPYSNGYYTTYRNVWVPPQTVCQ